MRKFENKNNIKGNVENVSKSKIKFITSLHRKKYRDEENAFVVEGVKMVEEALTEFPEHVLYCVHTSDFSMHQPKGREQHPIDHYLCDERTLKQCSSLQTPNKVLAVMRKFEYKAVEGHFKLVLDGVQDPGNMGTLIRLADWYGVSEIVCSETTVDCYNPKVVQASMGSIFRVPIRYISLPEYLSACEEPVYGALLEGENVYEQPLQPRGLLVLGNEGNGISEDLIPLLTHPLTIPRIGRAESLNVSTAGAILISEFFRKGFQE